MNPPEDAIRDEWQSMDFCFVCQTDRLHLFVEFADESVVESECAHCKALRERKDLSA